MLLEEVHDDIEDVCDHQSHDEGLQRTQHYRQKAYENRKILTYDAYCDSQKCNENIAFDLSFFHNEPKNGKFPPIISL